VNGRSWHRWRLDALTRALVLEDGDEQVVVQLELIRDTRSLWAVLVEASKEVDPDDAGALVGGLAELIPPEEICNRPGRLPAGWWGARCLVVGVRAGPVVRARRQLEELDVERLARRFKDGEVKAKCLIL